MKSEMDNTNTLKARIAEYRRETTVPCPHCGATWFKNTKRCSCGFIFLTEAHQKSPRNPWWPKIYDVDTARIAAIKGSQAVLFVSGLTAVLALLSLFNLFKLLAPTGLIDAAVFAFLGVMVRRMSRSAAVGALALFVGDRIYAATMHGLNVGIGPLLLALGFISGVRGTFGYHQYKKQNRTQQSAGP